MFRGVTVNAVFFKASLRTLNVQLNPTCCHFTGGPANWQEHNPCSPLLSFSTDAVHWTFMNNPLMYHEPGCSWNRAPGSSDLFAYVSLSADGGGKIGNDFWLYYTYLEPNTTFANRYLARKRVTFTPANPRVSSNQGSFFPSVDALKTAQVGSLCLWGGSP